MKKSAMCLLYLIIVPTFACTNIQIKAQDNAVVIGRTLEFGPSLKSVIISSPKGSLFTNKTKDSQKTHEWKSKYGYVYLNFFGQNHTVDGMNDQGLSAGFLYLPAYTKYPKFNTENAQNSLPYYQLADWILGQFKSTKEVKEALKDIDIYAQNLNVEGMGAVVFPIHVVVNDAQGQSIVIEFNKGEMQVFDNPLGILTNGPTFDWQLNNLKNYVNLTPYSVAPIKIGDIEYSATGQGAGMVGLPGDSTPPSRFVKVAFLQESAWPVKDAKQAVILAQYILDNVFIPNGMVRNPKGTPGTETTQWTVFKDLKNKKLYFKSYDSPALKVIDLNKLNLEPGAKVVKIPVSHECELAMDVTKLLQ